MSYAGLSILGFEVPSPKVPRGTTITPKPGSGGGFTIPGLPGLDVNSAAGPLVDAMMPLIEAKIPGVVAAASPAIQAEISKAMPGVRDELTKALPGLVSDLRTQVILGMIAQTAVILGVGWYFLKGPGSRGGM